MFSTDDTIAAIATPPGRGAIGIVRLSGPRSQEIAATLTGRARPFDPRRATFGRVRSAAGTGPAGTDSRAFDHVVSTCFPAPHSYTGEDLVEIGAHGSPVVLDGILREAIRHGARLARPGEFTLRAYLNGRIDLVQAEAVADLVDAVTPAQARVAFDQLEGTLTGELSKLEHMVFELITPLEASLDFPEEHYHFLTPDETRDAIARTRAGVETLLAGAAAGRMIREGAQIAILGRPNVGKSSLFNALLGAGRAIVSASPGTTRDLLTERADIGGVPLLLIDTAGMRESGDEIEQEGVRRAREAAAVADLCLVVFDASAAMTTADNELLAVALDRPHLLVLNKCDLLPDGETRHTPALVAGGSVALQVSARTGDGIEALRVEMAGRLGAAESLRDTARVSNTRHVTLLEDARRALDRAIDALAAGATEEFVLVDLHDALRAFELITGGRSTDDVLNAIFERFCIGK